MALEIRARCTCQQEHCGKQIKTLQNLGGAYAKRYENTCRYVHLLNKITMTTLHGEGRSYPRCPALPAGARREAGASSKRLQQFLSVCKGKGQKAAGSPQLTRCCSAGWAARTPSQLCSTQPAPFSRGLKRGCQASSPNTELLPRYT